MPIARPRAPRPELSWSRWGDPALATPLPDGLRTLLRQALGITEGRAAPASIEDLELEPVRLVPQVAAELEAVVGKANARGDRESRARHALGKSTLDLLRLRANRPIAAPDLVLMPADHDEVLALLSACAHHRVAVTPFGGGTSVVGGLAPEAAQFAGAVAIDVRRMNAPVGLDEVSRLAVLEPGLRVPRPSSCWASAATRSDTSRSPTSTPPSGALPPPVPAVRPRPDTGSSTRPRRRSGSPHPPRRPAAAWRSWALRAQRTTWRRGGWRPRPA